MLSDQVEDVTLIGRVAAGDAEAFAELFRRRHGQIVRSLRQRRAVAGSAQPTAVAAEATR